MPRLSQQFRLALILLLCASCGQSVAQGDAQAVILQYHHVASDTPPVTSLSTESFREHMAYLDENGFSIMRLEEVLSRIQEGQSLPDRTAVITFDDGYRNVYDNAYPILRDYGWPFTIFVTSGLVQNNPRQYASWEQLREMAEHGATLANHTVSHPYLLERQPGENKTQWLNRVESQIVDAERQIAEETGQNHRLLAYPYGEYDPDIQALVEELGFIGIGQQSGPINATSDFTALPRFPFSGIYASMNTFPVKVNSLAFNLEEVRPVSPVTDETGPEAILAFGPGQYRLENFSCYHSNDRIEVEQEGERRFRVDSDSSSRSRRFRYNCTAPGPDGRFYWYSKHWVNPAIPE